jgi:small conductance mechanosensitive channel
MRKDVPALAGRTADRDGAAAAVERKRLSLAWTFSHRPGEVDMPELETDWLTADFWTGMARATAAWALQAAPRILLILVLTLVALKGLRWVCSELGRRAVRGGTEGDPGRSREHEKRIETLEGIVRTAGTIAIWVVAGMLLLMQVGVNVAPLIAGAGIVGLAVGFGAQDLVRDVITGFFLLLENHVRKGDVAIINGTGGLVEEIGLRTIVLRDMSGTVHVFQNGKVQTLSNMTKGWSAMVFDVGVAYKEDTDQVAAVMREVSEELRADPDFADKILEPMEIFGVDSFGDNAVVVKGRLKTRPIEQWAVGREYRRRLKKAFDARNIEIPFPHRTIYWGEASRPLQLVSKEEPSSTRAAAAR